MNENSLIGRVRELRQPNETTCGQTCVAMLTGETVEAVCSRIGHAGTTRLPELTEALHASGRVRAGGFEDPASVRGFAPLALVSVPPAPGDKAGHWVLWVGDAYLDPTWGEVDAARMWAFWELRGTCPRDLVVLELMP